MSAKPLQLKVTHKENCQHPNRMTFQGQSMDHQLFKCILSLKVYPQVEMFTTSWNLKFPSTREGSRRMGVFKIDWNQWQTIYLFQPVKSHSAVLNSLLSYKVVVVLITLWWLSQLVSHSDRWVRHSYKVPKPLLFELVQGQRVTCHSWL